MTLPTRMLVMIMTARMILIVITNEPHQEDVHDTDLENVLGHSTPP